MQIPDAQQNLNSGKKYFGDEDQRLFEVTELKANET